MGSVPGLLKSDKTLQVSYTVEAFGKEFKHPTVTFFAESKVRNELNQKRESPNVQTCPADGSTKQYYYPRVIPN